MSNHTTKLRDALAAADSYVLALEMMAETALSKSNAAAFCSFSLILDQAKKELATAHEVVDAMEGELC